MSPEEIQQKIKALSQSGAPDDNLRAFELMVDELGMNKKKALAQLEPMTVLVRSRNQRNNYGERYVFEIGDVVLEYEEWRDDMVFEVDEFIDREIYFLENGARIRTKYGKRLWGWVHARSGPKEEGRQNLRKTVWEDFKKCIPILLNLLEGNREEARYRPAEEEPTPTPPTPDAKKKTERKPTYSWNDQDMNKIWYLFHTKQASDYLDAFAIMQHRWGLSDEDAMRNLCQYLMREMPFTDSGEDVIDHTWQLGPIRIRAYYKHRGNDAFEEYFDEYDLFLEAESESFKTRFRKDMGTISNYFMEPYPMLKARTHELTELFEQMIPALLQQLDS